MTDMRRFGTAVRIMIVEDKECKVYRLRNDYLAKPIQIDKMLKVISKMLKKRKTDR